MKVYIVDNYDSFTYNLYQMIGEILQSEKNKQQAYRISNSKLDSRLNKCFEHDLNNFEIIVKRNDEISLEDIKTYAPDKIIISPGPGSPDDERYFGICTQVIKSLGQTIPILGICLGMQGIVHAFGGKIVKATVPMHGKTSILEHNGRGIFADVPNGLEIMRYHSLMAQQDNFPDILEITANSEGDNEIMGVQHRQYPIYGVQFHPESFLSEGGHDLMRNFLFN
ncbi:aminodeoxychorismate synthase subunit II [Gammaproteobacteria bacterium]|nr:aminodeoxychorismate synthase subunit II [Gammaproteobacteria bacterium]